MSTTVCPQRLSAAVRTLAVLAAGGAAVGWLSGAWWRLGRGLATTGRATPQPEASFENLIAEVAGVVLLVAITALVLSACLTALEALVLAVAGSPFNALTRVSRSSGPAWWRRVVLLACGAGLCTLVTTPVSYAGDPDPVDACQAACTDIEGLSLPDLPARTSVPLPRRHDDQQTVVVGPGDCLWDIARHELGPRTSDAELAVRVDAWYTHNRLTLGPDPDLIFPGTHLQRPEDFR